MKRGFTLLELIVVIIIIGVLATIGLTQYGRMVERSRGAEARTVLGDLRKLAAAYRLEKGTLVGIADTNLNLGLGEDLIPNVCPGQTSHYFAYTFGGAGADTVTFTATRCGVGEGKTPGSVPSAGLTLTLAPNYATGVDTWGGTGNY